MSADWRDERGNASYEAYLPDSLIYSCTVIYALIGIAALYFVARDIQERLRNNTQCNMTVKFSILLCFTLTCITRLLLFSLCVTTPMKNITVALLFVIPLSVMFTANCLWVVFWIDLYHTSLDNAPIEQIHLRKYQYSFYGLSSAQFVMLFASMGFELLDVAFWNSGHSKVIFAVKMTANSVFWLFLSAVFMYYVVKSRQRLLENSEALGGHTIAVMHRVVSALTVLSVSLFLASVDGFLVSFLSPKYLLTVSVMAWILIEMVPMICILYIFSFPLHMMELFKKQAKKKWFEM